MSGIELTTIAAVASIAGSAASAVSLFAGQDTPSLPPPPPTPNVNEQTAPKQVGSEANKALVAEQERNRKVRQRRNDSRREGISSLNKSSSTSLLGD